jgi:hypothetical protein
MRQRARHRADRAGSTHKIDLQRMDQPLRLPVQLANARMSDPPNGGLPPVAQSRRMRTVAQTVFFTCAPPCLSHESPPGPRHMLCLCVAKVPTGET